MKKRWVSIDGWRGDYEPVPPEGWEILLTCEVVNEAGEQLGAIVKKKLKELKIKYRSGFLRSSNVFSANYYIIIEKNKLSDEIKKAIENWFIINNNSTFNIFTGDSYNLDIESSQKEFDEIFNNINSNAIV